MTNDKIESRLIKVSKALIALEEIAFIPVTKDRAYIDATIQRYEFTIELFWKFLKAILESKGVEVQYPKDVLKESYQGQLIDDEAIWLSMLNDRNLTSHTYDEALADQIYGRIQTYIPILRKTFEHLIKDFG